MVFYFHLLLMVLHSPDECHSSKNTNYEIKCQCLYNCVTCVLLGMYVCKNCTHTHTHISIENTK